MKIEKIIVLIFLAIGVISGFISNFFVTAQNNLVTASFLPPVIFLIALLLSKQALKNVKLKLLVYNSLITFILFWFVAWLALYQFSIV